MALGPDRICLLLDIVLASDARSAAAEALVVIMACMLPKGKCVASARDTHLYI